MRSHLHSAGLQVHAAAVKISGNIILLCKFLFSEYLAPEFIFNLGHDSSCDIWALGVLLYEMFMIGTPFAPAKADNVTELFTNIATVKVRQFSAAAFLDEYLNTNLNLQKSGLNLPHELEQSCDPLPARALITSLLQPEPSE